MILKLRPEERPRVREVKREKAANYSRPRDQQSEVLNSGGPGESDGGTETSAVLVERWGVGKGSR